MKEIMSLKVLMLIKQRMYDFSLLVFCRQRLGFRFHSSTCIGYHDIMMMSFAIVNIDILSIHDVD